MLSENFINQITKAFPEDINKSVLQNGNEIYLDVNPSKIYEICVYLNCRRGYPLVSMFASDESSISGNYAVYYTFADRENGILVTVKVVVDPRKPAIPSICETVHAAALYEREIHDMFGIAPEGHPDPKRLVFHGNWPEGEYPLRKDFDLNRKLEFTSPETAKNKIRFTKISGDGVYEIPVGPVHAGIIEPGHFRFSVAGEPIINLEAQLYFAHKGIEKLCEGSSIERCLFIAERISGDETYTNSLAYCQAIEKIAGVTVPDRAAYMRVLFCELERLTSHLGDLAGICVDASYAFAASQFNMIRNWAYQLADQLCGARFLRGVNRLGGLKKDFLQGNEKKAIEQLTKILFELDETTKIIESNSLFIDRVENTGILTKETATDLNAVGPGGRASGIKYDLRKAFPYAAYQVLEFEVPVFSDGDVNSRMRVKLAECIQSISLMRQSIEAMPSGCVIEAISSVEPYRFAFGMTEAPRGENIHWLMTGENNTVFRYKIRTPSFCNWPALCHAVKGNIVPDFPLINKSFNLSYAGNDL